MTYSTITQKLQVQTKKRFLTCQLLEKLNYQTEELEKPGFQKSFR